MQDRKRLEDSIASDDKVRALTEDLDTLFELAREGESVSADIDRDMKPYAALLEQLETAMLLSGENDARSAIVTIHPGAGRHREPGLGRDAAPHVSPLDGAPRL